MVQSERELPVKTYDVIVIGLGAMGSSAAYQLAKRGQRVLGLEQYYPAHAKGSSHGTTRMIRKSAFEHPDYVPLGQRSYELWEELEQLSGRRLVTNTGGLYIGSPEEHYIKGSIETARAYGIEHEVLSSDELRRRYPQIMVKDEQIAYSEPDMGVVTPGKCILAYQQLAQRSGADLHFGEKVLRWEADSDKDWVRVHTDEATYEAKRLVITIGAWASVLLEEMNMPLQIERHWIFWFEPEESALESLRVEKFPLVNVVADGGVAYTSWPAFGEEQVVKATFVDIDAEVCTPETMLLPSASQEEIASITRNVQQYVPSAAGPLVSMESCMYVNAPDEHFVISSHPHHSNVAVAAGMAGHGFKFTPVVGEILADLAIDGQTSYNIELFHPKRFDQATGTDR